MNHKELMRGMWVVTSGPIANETDHSLTREFPYNIGDYNEDLKTPDRPMLFIKQRELAYSYARYVADPTKTQWVEVKWTSY